MTPQLARFQAAWIKRSTSRNLPVAEELLQVGDTPFDAGGQPVSRVHEERSWLLGRVADRFGRREIVPPRDADPSAHGQCRDPARAPELTNLAPLA